MEERGKASVVVFLLDLPWSLLLQSLLEDPAGVSSSPPFVTHPRCSLRKVLVWCAHVVPSRISSKSYFRCLLVVREKDPRVSQDKWGWRNCSLMLSSQELVRKLSAACLSPSLFWLVLFWDCCMMGTRKVPRSLGADGDSFPELPENSRASQIPSAGIMYESFAAVNCGSVCLYPYLSFLLGSELSALVLKTFTAGPISFYALERGGDMEEGFTASCVTKITMPPQSDPVWNDREVKQLAVLTVSTSLFQKNPEDFQLCSMLIKMPASFSLRSSTLILTVFMGFIWC